MSVNKVINIDGMYARAALPDSANITPNNMPPIYRNSRIYELIEAVAAAENAPVSGASIALSPSGERALAPCRTSSSPGISEEAYEVTAEAMRLVREESRGGVLHSEVNPGRILNLDDLPNLYYRLGTDGCVHVHTHHRGVGNQPASPARISLLEHDVSNWRPVSMLSVRTDRRSSLTHYVRIHTMEYSGFEHFSTSGSAPADKGGKILVVTLAKVDRLGLVPDELLETLLVIRVPVGIPLSQFIRLIPHLIFDEETFAYLDAKHGTKAVESLNLVASTWHRKVNVYYNRQPVLAARTQLSANIRPC